MTRQDIEREARKKFGTAFNQIRVIEAIDFAMMIIQRQREEDAEIAQEAARDTDCGHCIAAKIRGKGCE